MGAHAEGFMEGSGEAVAIQICAEQNGGYDLFRHDGLRKLLSIGKFGCYLIHYSTLFRKFNRIFQKSKKKLKKFFIKTNSSQKRELFISAVLQLMYKCTDYCCSGAPTGQVPAQAPQSMHSSALITYLPSCSEIALTGQPSAQAPQPRHVSALIT